MPERNGCARRLDRRHADRAITATDDKGPRIRQRGPQPLLRGPTLGRKQADLDARGAQPLCEPLGGRERSTRTGDGVEEHDDGHRRCVT